MIRKRDRKVTRDQEKVTLTKNHNLGKWSESLRKWSTASQKIPKPHFHQQHPLIHIHDQRFDFRTHSSKMGPNLYSFKYIIAIYNLYQVFTFRLFDLSTPSS